MYLNMNGKYFNTFGYLLKEIIQDLPTSDDWIVDYTLKDNHETKWSKTSRHSKLSGFSKFRVSRSKINSGLNLSWIKIQM